MYIIYTIHIRTLQYFIFIIFFKKKKKAPSHKKRTKVVRKENYVDEVDWIVHHQFITPSRIKELLLRCGIVSWIYLQITGFN